MGKEMDVELELEVDVVTLTTDDGEIDCGILTVLELNDREYIAEIGRASCRERV